MQGRLSAPRGGMIQEFPTASWREEFAAAREAGLDCIEWIYDEHSADDNPICDDTGIAEVAAISSREGVAVTSVCADYLMPHPVLRPEGRVDLANAEVLRWIIERAERLGSDHVVLPLVDESSLAAAGGAGALEGLLRQLAPTLKGGNVEVHLETDVPAAELAATLNHLGVPGVGVTLDLGNSAARGQDAAEEMASLGSLIRSVHVKDRVREGGTVLLGQGDADMKTYFRALQAQEYDGDYILQVARGDTGGELEAARHNRDWILRILHETRPGVHA